MKRIWVGVKARLVRALESWLTLSALIGLAALCALERLVRHHDALVAGAIVAIHPAMEQAEMREVLKPLKADWPIKTKDGSNNTYLFHGIDEFVVVVTDGTDDDARVTGVNHVPDAGPFWERCRRNWESRIR